MATSLILALTAIAGLGIFALVLIFFGGTKKNKHASYVKNKSPVVAVEEEKWGAKTNSHSNHSEEPLIADKSPSVEQTQQIHSPLMQEDDIDPAIASLGFSALDDLLTEPDVATQFNEPLKSPGKTPVAFKPSTTKKKQVSQDIIVLYVLAPADQPFVGYELLQAVTAAGLRFGEMDIFHRYHEDYPEEKIFSLCSAVEPGFFDMANIGALVCPGLSLFMQISQVHYPKQAFNWMLETAEQLAQDLGGYVADEQRQPLTNEKLEWYFSLI